MPRTLPYGTWPSPLSAAEAARSAPRLEGARFVGEDVWWGESVPAAGGRMSVRSREHGILLPAPWNVSSRVHEYGGGAWTASPEGALYFVEKTDQCVWALEPGAAAPRRLTPPELGWRFGGLRIQHGVLLAVRETHGERTGHDIVRIGTGEHSEVVSLAGGGFVAHPALSPDGGMLAWIGWEHPDMPWDRAQLRVGRLGEDGVRDAVVLAGAGSAALQPEWTADGRILFADDVTGRWNLWRADAAAGAAPEPVSPADADTGGPLWVLGTRWFRTLADGRIVAVRTNGDDALVVVDPDGTTRQLPAPVCAGVSVEDVSGTRVLLTGSGRAGAAAVWELDVDAPDAAVRLSAGEAAWAPEWTPATRAVVFPGPHGPVHAYLHPPTSPAAAAPAGEKPPYLVLVHGGPTSHTSSTASAKVVYFTSRGIGVLDVNYGGSTGYGRAYRERLRGAWGVVDVDDVAAAASALAGSGQADPARLAIEGGSAGGWTVLSALVSTDVFAAGISRYGVGDARLLAEDTHDFESRYLDGLIGPLPEAAALYRERSPLSHAERFTVPVLLLQGEEDPVVPPEQAEAIRAALHARGVPHAYVLYPGEGHGFRRPETTVDVLEKELAFLGAVFAFTPPGVPDLPLQ